MSDRVTKLFDSRGHLLPPEQCNIQVLEALTKHRARSPSRRSPSRHGVHEAGNERTSSPKLPKFVQEVSQKTKPDNIRIAGLSKLHDSKSPDQIRISSPNAPQNGEHIIGDNRLGNTTAKSSKQSVLSSKSNGKVEMESDDATTVELMEKPVLDWTSKDVGVWLDYIGLSKFKEKFLNHNVSGKILLDLSYEMLEKLSLSQSEDRELFLAEVYHLQEDAGQVDDEEQEADKEIEETLQSARPSKNNNDPTVLAFQNEGISLTPTDSFASSRTGSETAPSPTLEMADSEAQREHSSKSTVGQNTFEKPNSTITSSQTSPSRTKSKKELTKQTSKKLKPRGKRISRLFNSFHGTHKDPSLLHTAPPIYKNAFHNLMNSGPQGVIKIWTEMFLTDMQYVSLLIKHEHTAFEVIKMVLEKSNALEDPECYRICEINENKKEYILERDECPLQKERQWSDPDNCRFELRWRNERLIEWGNTTGPDTQDLSKEKVIEESSLQESHVEVPNGKTSSPLSSESTSADDLPGSPGSSDVAEDDVLETEFAYIAPVDHGKGLADAGRTSGLTNGADVQNDSSIEDPKSIQGASKVRLTSSCPDLSSSDLTDGDPEYGNLLISKNYGFLNAEIDLASVGIDDDATTKLDVSAKNLDGSAKNPDGSAKNPDGSAMTGEFEYSQQLRKSSKRLSERLRLKAQARIKGEAVEIGVDVDKQDDLRIPGDHVDGKKDAEQGDVEMSVDTHKDPLVQPTVNEYVPKTPEDERVLKQTGDEAVLKEPGDEKSVVILPDLSEILKNVKELQNDNLLLAEENRELKKNCRTFEGKSRLKERELEEMETEKNELANQVQDMISELHSLRAANAELRTEVDEANAKLSDVDGWVTRDVFEDIRGQLSVSLEEVENKENEVKEISKKCKLLEVENMKIQELQAEIDELNERRKEDNKVLDEMKKELKDQQKKMLEVELETQNMQKSFEEKENERKVAEDILSKVEMEVESLKQQHSDEKKDLEKRCADREYEILIMKEEKKELCVKMKSFESNVETLQEEMKKKVAEHEAAIAEMETQSAIKDESLSQTFSSLEQLVNERDLRIKQLKKQVELSELPQNELQAKEHEYEQNKVYLKHLIALVKEKDPSILDVLNKTLSSRDSEDWC